MSGSRKLFRVHVSLTTYVAAENAAEAERVAEREVGRHPLDDHGGATLDAVEVAPGHQLASGWDEDCLAFKDDGPDARIGDFLRPSGGPPAPDPNQGELFKGGAS